MARDTRLARTSSTTSSTAPARCATTAAPSGATLRLDRVARAAVAGPPSLEYDDFPREVPKREIAVSDAAARLANALHLHLD